MAFVHNALPMHSVALERYAVKANVTAELAAVEKIVPQARHAKTMCVEAVCLTVNVGPEKYVVTTNVAPANAALREIVAALRV